MPPTGIHFGGQRWSAEPDPAHEQRARNPKLPATLRLIEAAKARGNRYGHAAFQSGQLQTWLAGANGRGAVRSTISRAINAAVEWGYLAPVSTSRCLMLVREGWTRGYGRMSACHEPRHEGHRYHEWFRDGWGTWQAPRRLDQARVAAELEELGGLYLDQATGQLVNGTTGEVLPLSQHDVADSATPVVVENTA